jgi:hypothetical protein
VDILQHKLRVVIVRSAGKLYGSANWEMSLHDSNHAYYQVSVLHLLYLTIFMVCRHER